MISKIGSNGKTDIIFYPYATWHSAIFETFGGVADPPEELQVYYIQVDRWYVKMSPCIQKQ